MKTILDFTAEEVREYLLRHESYITLKLPDFINFSSLLEKLYDNLKKKELKNIKIKWPSDIERLNYEILQNKSNKYDWRKITFIHPVLYVELVKLISQEENWQKIKERFLIQNSILVSSIPVQPIEGEKEIANQIKNYKTNFEMKTIEESINYNVMFVTDITGCYSEIYTHSIPWAIHGKEEAKKEKSNKNLLGNKVDKLIQGMSYGQTNGIPQGSVLMDFIAEIVLNYADIKLSEVLKEKLDVSNYKILRYRDDYRILSKSKKIGEKILLELSKVLIELGLKLNSKKTNYYSNIIEGAVKKDKLEWKSLRVEKNIINRLLILHKYTLENKNSSILYSEFSKISKKLEDLEKEKPLERAEKNLVLSLICDIGINNPRIYIELTRCLSIIINSLETLDEKKECFRQIINKFEEDSYSDILKIWLYRISIAVEGLDFNLNDNLKKLLKKEVKVSLWDNSWICDKEEELLKILKREEIIEEKKESIWRKKIDKKELSPIISEEEIRVFDGYLRR